MNESAVADLRGLHIGDHGPCPCCVLAAELARIERDRDELRQAWSMLEQVTTMLERKIIGMVASVRTAALADGL